MSAIAGIFHYDQEPINTEHGHRMMFDLEKYPADDIQVWHHEKIFLGCHAQWITPESIGERLPYYDQNRKLAITADAIIDNRDELFEKLQIERDRRAGIPDSELILLAYHKWAEDAPKHLIGDFAFMIWDERKQMLFGARDFSGSRTLYFHSNAKRFAFCTAIEPLLTLPYVKKELNEQWLAEYLAISAVVEAVDASITPYQHIDQLLPSHSISITGGQIKLTRYCTLTAGERLKLKSNDEYVEAFQDVFRTAVQSRLRTNRGVGAQLSGGLDSGSIVSFAANALSKNAKRLHTFSYIPPKDFKDYTPRHLMADERPFIHSTVQHVGGINDHYLDLEGKNSYTEIDDFLEITELPYKYFENSFWIKGIFEKAQQEGIGVLLSGARGNLSISWGSAYEHYALLLKKMKWVRLVQELHHYSSKVGGSRLRRLPEVARVAFPIIDRIFPSEDKPYIFPRIINQNLAKRTNVFNRLKDYGIDQTGWFSSNANLHELRRKHFKDVFHWNTTNTLTAKLSLRYSLWQRDPTNDLRVIRFCLSVPEEQYVQNGVDRSLIRRSTEKLLPDKVRLNLHYRGVQGADWVHRMIPHWDTYKAELKQLSKDDRILSYLDGDVLNAALVKVEAGAIPEYATDADYKILMRSLILYRYMKKFA
ncbi:lasso peptide isopeptide bond-forming cyclase [Paenibacillus chondroitinus]|uniref:asparagine synthase (glutamine-hydrolyzing) n=1 Tax=Paenibacillus chondroitinus TaxID=59842 RepID=A0ABU6DIS1_9BACL|nr:MULTISPECIES: lasso peptide isopeptide bond-forming cyclase [Paenibacillus]MCY9660239.1 lasso peptide isopeptide bond-forming cyclase [Paenibacillus anseongense]MEB4797665.1 lasso peptide isopeptide bond-forming cyclase [Paenibacillus chondroitinus]